MSNARQYFAARLDEAINYRKGGGEVRSAYNRWKREKPNEESRSTMSFVAGWNAAQAFNPPRKWSRFESLDEITRSASLGDLQWFTVDVTQKIGEAYNAALTLKGSMDRMEEIPASLRKMYDRNLKVMSMLGKAKQEAYQTQMEMRRIR